MNLLVSLLLAYCRTKPSPKYDCFTCDEKVQQQNMKYEQYINIPWSNHRHCIAHGALHFVSVYQIIDPSIFLQMTRNIYCWVSHQRSIIHKSASVSYLHMIQRLQVVNCGGCLPCYSTHEDKHHSLRAKDSVDMFHEKSNQILLSCDRLNVFWWQILCIEPYLLYVCMMEIRPLIKLCIENLSGKHYCVVLITHPCNIYV